MLTASPGPQAHAVLRYSARSQYNQRHTEYGTPKPPYAKRDKAPARARPQTSQPQARRSWDYKSPQKYTSPRGYSAIKPYQRPQAYGPGQDSGGGSGGGGNGRFGGGGDGGGDFGSNLPKYTAILFAMLVAVGGYMGYKKKGSTASLKASGAFAAALLIAGILIGGPMHTAGLAIALAANLGLGGYMLRGYVNTRKIFPQAVFTALSGLNSLLYIQRLTGS